MKLYVPVMDTVVEFTTDAVPALVLESPKSFLDLLQDIQAQIDGYEGKTVLSIQEKPVNMGKYVELISSFVPFEINRKPLLTKILSFMEKLATDAEHFSQTQRLLADIELFVDDLVSESPCDIISERICIGPILKAVGIQLRDEYDSLMEKLLDYMELVREFERDRLFILVNSRSFFEPETLDLFLESVLSHDFKVLLLDSHAEILLHHEKRLTLDKDLCVF